MANSDSFLLNHSALRNLETGEEVACKKLIKVFDKPILARRALREIKLLRHLNGHENVGFYMLGLHCARA